MNLLRYSQFITENLITKKCIIITENGFQDRELFEPLNIINNSGTEVIVAGLTVGEKKAYNSEKTISIHQVVGDLKASDFDFLLLPGGKAPLILKEDQSVIQFVRDFAKLNRPIFAICHGPLILASADLVKDKNMTCYSDAVEELEQAGANFKDESVVCDGQFVTSRNPDDLENFCKKISERLL